MTPHGRARTRRTEGAEGPDPPHSALVVSPLGEAQLDLAVSLLQLIDAGIGRDELRALLPVEDHHSLEGSGDVALLGAFNTHAVLVGVMGCRKVPGGATEPLLRAEPFVAAAYLDRMLTEIVVALLSEAERLGRSMGCRRITVMLPAPLRCPAMTTALGGRGYIGTNGDPRFVAPL